MPVRCVCLAQPPRGAYDDRMSLPDSLVANLTAVREPVVLSWSGGKDSMLALEALRADDTVEVVGLLTSVTREYDRISIHGVRRELLEAQARALSLPLHIVWLDAACSNASYEQAFLAAVRQLCAIQPGLRRIAFGDLFLADVRAYRERLLEAVGLRTHFPLWLRDTGVLARHFIASGYRAYLTCIDTTQIDQGFAGRSFDLELLAGLPASADPCGEKGEFHTFVFDGPEFRQPVACSPEEVVLRDQRFAYCDLIGTR